MNETDLRSTPHRRWNPLLREWVLVSPHRTQRPWLGKVDKEALTTSIEYDPECYLCPGNIRAEGHRNPSYAETFVFDNDYPAMLPNVSPSEVEQEGLIVGQVERGICRVVCFSPRHDLTIPRMEQEEVRRVVEVWTQQYQELGEVPWVKHVQIFENRGVLMGASNPHPHCQIWANEELPNLPMREQAAMREFLKGNEKCLLCEYLRLEVEDGERIVCENEGFLALVPYWAVWPFETIILSRRHLASLATLEDTEPRDLADILRRLTIRYDNLFETAFPYSMGFHQEPTDGESHPEFHFHAHYFPPLLRSATVQKFMVGYEMLAGPQRDITPEGAAARLRNLAEKHYLDGH
ncbi:MAG TPA: UDP-glucose--hexose-1-phosphate uridylyltransferase [Candidatus Acidoferrum sp.]|nr:UDP-glucose--hexose-1-phosphate uridylyltransferase [Candidatus Acidoferrum sp.]